MFQLNFGFFKKGLLGFLRLVWVLLILIATPTTTTTTTSAPSVRGGELFITLISILFLAEKFFFVLCNVPEENITIAEVNFALVCEIAV